MISMTADQFELSTRPDMFFAPRHHYLIIISSRTSLTHCYHVLSDVFTDLIRLLRHRMLRHKWTDTFTWKSDVSFVDYLHDTQRSHIQKERYLSIAGRYTVKSHNMLHLSLMRRRYEVIVIITRQFCSFLYPWDNRIILFSRRTSVFKKVVVICHVYDDELSEYIEDSIIISENGMQIFVHSSFSSIYSINNLYRKSVQAFRWKIWLDRTRVWKNIISVITRDAYVYTIVESLPATFRNKYTKNMKTFPSERSMSLNLLDHTDKKTEGNWVDLL